MSYIHAGGHKDNGSIRPLASDFTERALRNAIRAKQRRVSKKRFDFLKTEIFPMKLLKSLRTVPGAAAVVAIVATSSVGAYALSNWFGGTVPVKEDASVFSVDLSSCRGSVLPGINENDDLHNIKFKITGRPHISAQDLQQDLLGDCEYNAVVDFYAAKFPEAGFTNTGHPAAASQRFNYTLLPATVVVANHGSITVKSTGSKADSFGTRTLTLAPDASIYDESRTASVDALQPGDSILFVAYSASAGAPMTEGTTLLNKSDIQVRSIFKTHYNDGTSSSFGYQTNNVMLLDQYQQLHK